MRKVIGLISITVLAAVGMLGIAAQGALAGEPQGADDCTPGSNPGLYHGWVQTTVTRERTETGLKGGVVMCGNSDTTRGIGYKEGFIRTTGLHQRIGNPDKYGMELRCANPDNNGQPGRPNACTTSQDLQSGRFVGSVTTDVLLWLEIGGVWHSGFVEEVPSSTYVDHDPAHPEWDWDCPATEDPDGSGPWPSGPVVQCQQGINNLGYTNITVVKIASGTGGGANTGQYVTHIRQPVGGEYDLYYAKIGSRGQWNDVTKKWEKDSTDIDSDEMDTCKYAGEVGGTECGEDLEPPLTDGWLQKTGLASMYTDVVGTLVGPAPFQFRGIFFNGSQYQKKNVNIRQKWTQ